MPNQDTNATYHILHDRGYTSLRAMTPKGRTKGWGSSCLLEAPALHASSAPEPGSASEPSAPEVPTVGATVPVAPLWISSCTPITKRESSSIFCWCSKSGSCTGRLRSMSKVSWPAGTLGSPWEANSDKSNFHFHSIPHYTVPNYISDYTIRCLGMLVTHCTVSILIALMIKVYQQLQSSRDIFVMTCLFPHHDSHMEKASDTSWCPHAAQVST